MKKIHFVGILISRFHRTTKLTKIGIITKKSAFTVTQNLVNGLCPFIICVWCRHCTIGFLFVLKRYPCGKILILKHASIDKFHRKNTDIHVPDRTGATPNGGRTTLATAKQSELHVIAACYE